MAFQTAIRGADDRLDYTEENGLLAAVSTDAFSLLRPHLRQHALEKGTLLWDVNESIGHIYFPHSGLISITLLGSEGQYIEVGSIGPESAAGLYELSADAARSTRATMCIGGIVSSIPAEQFREVAQQNEELAALAALSRDWQLQQAQQMAACNASHSADARLARWLYSAGERTGSDMIPMTQEELAAMLGIRRTTATLLAQGLHNKGAIDYARGRIRIRDRDALVGAACSCCKAFGREHWPSTRIDTLRP